MTKTKKSERKHEKKSERKHDKKNKSFIHLVSSTNPKQRKVLVNSMCNGQLKYICEIMINFLKGTFVLPDNIKKKVEPFRSLIRLLADKGISLARKKNFLGVRSNTSTVGKVLNYLYKFIETI
jgi:hypothetical protein